MWRFSQSTKIPKFWKLSFGFKRRKWKEYPSWWIVHPLEAKESICQTIQLHGIVWNALVTWNIYLIIKSDYFNITQRWTVDHLHEGKLERFSNPLTQIFWEEGIEMCILNQFLKSFLWILKFQVHYLRRLLMLTFL